MDDVNFPFPKINRPKKSGDKTVDTELNMVFDSLDRYLNIIKPYIFTDIKLAYDENDDRFILSRVQQNLSNILLRSLYIRNGIVDSINSRNTVSLFSNLKSFIEVPAMLAHIFSLVNNSLDKKLIKNSLISMALGNKGEGSLRIGRVEAVNILTMFKKLDDFINQLKRKGGSSENDMIMSDFYGLVCNATHPNYDAHDITAKFEVDRGYWRGLLPEEFKKNFISESSRYKPPLMVSIIMIEALSKRILKCNTVDNFEKLDNILYFNNQ